MGPIIRPLDFSLLMSSHEATHSELARTVEDLAQWLSVVEFGLSSVLDKAAEHTIEEEQEQEDPPGQNNSTPDTFSSKMFEPPIPPSARAVE